MTLNRSSHVCFKLQRNDPNETNGAGHNVSLIVMRNDTRGTGKYTVFCIIFYRLKQVLTLSIYQFICSGIPAITPELQVLSHVSCPL